ncbi:MAG: TIGR01777 family oxidoreductase [Planctomycetota bacterium]
MRLFVTGATGLLGRRLVLDRLERGDHVTVLSRHGAKARGLFAADVNANVVVVEGDPGVPGPWQKAVDGMDAVIHLAGAGIADKRWNKAYKETIRRSRVDGTYQVADAVLHAASPPRVVISASAVGIYGDRGDVAADESTPPADDFLAQLAVDWESQANRMQSPRTRIVNLRIGIVLDERGGALGQMLPLFRKGIGGRLGNGRQYMSWVHWRDIIGLIDHALDHDAVQGPLNAVAPNAVMNKSFTKSLARVLRRPAFFFVPKIALRIGLGEFAKFLTTSLRVAPARAIETGYTFQFSDLDVALESLLGSSHNDDGPPVVDEPRPESPDGQPDVMAPDHIRMVAVDIDGTLLTSDGTIGRGVINACRAAHRAGCLVVPATSRPPRAVASIMQMLDVPGPVVAYNGAIIWDPAERAVLHHETIDADAARSIVSDVREAYPSIFIAVEIEDRWFTDRAAQPSDGNGLWLTEPDGVQPLYELLEQPITKLNIVGPADMIAEVQSLIGDRYWKTRRVSMFVSDPRFVQIMSPMVDKGIAVQRIARQHGIPQDQVMAIGDASNDMGMIEWAGFGVAVANAASPVRALADAVVPANDEGGVARAIQRFVLNPADRMESMPR